MLILALRTDKPEAELMLLNDTKVLAKQTWQAHRALAATLHSQIDALLEFANLRLEDLQGVIFFSGPGSFTGLRIGASVANALSDSLGIPAVQAAGEDWVERGSQLIAGADATNKVAPEYGGAAHITKPKR